MVCWFKAELLMIKGSLGLFKKFYMQQKKGRRKGRKKVNRREKTDCDFNFLEALGFFL